MMGGTHRQGRQFGWMHVDDDDDEEEDENEIKIGKKGEFRPPKQNGRDSARRVIRLVLV